MECAPDDLTPDRRYALAIGTIVPRPIAVVGSVAPDGRFNLAPFSFFTIVSSDPFMVAFCPANDEAGEEKDSLRNAKPAWEGGTGCFTISVATAANIERIVACGEDIPYGESEFAFAGLTPLTSRRIAAPRLAESPVCYECETFQVLRFGPGRSSAGNMVIGRVVHIHIDDALFDSHRRIDPAKLDAVGRMGGISYARTRDRIDVPFGRAALASLNRASEQSRA